MAKARNTHSRSKVSPEIVQQLNLGTRAPANLMEGLVVDFATLMKNACPRVSESQLLRFTADSPTITRRMAIGGQIVREIYGTDLEELLLHPSDTVRGWVAFAWQLEESWDLAARINRFRPLAIDEHFGVREWAWMALRPHLVADLDSAIQLLNPWVVDESPFARRFAVEATRPRGVWCSHITELKTHPERALTLLEPLQTEPEKYVQDSVANWLNDASKTQPQWVQQICQRWLKAHPAEKSTARICQRATRSIKA
ncbi:MAG: DNA alkylation repair protein [Zavarzinella sp.]